MKQCEVVDIANVRGAQHFCYEMIEPIETQVREELARKIS